MSRARGGAVHPPFYARVLRLRHLAPSGFLCFIFLEGAVALGILLALAELVSWWGVLVLPLAVAAMVKLNDVVAGALTPAQPPPAVVRPAIGDQPAPPAIGEGATARLPGGAIKRPWVERVEAQQQRARQSATRRYE